MNPDAPLVGQLQVSTSIRALPPGPLYRLGSRFYGLWGRLSGHGSTQRQFLRRQLEQRLKISTVTDHAITWLTGTKPTGMFISGPNHASHRGRAHSAKYVHT